MPKHIKWIISVLMAATIFRAQTVMFLPKVEVFGGPAPNAWFGPWFSDSILGFLVPVMVFIFWTRSGMRVWGALLVYNALGAFDYANGLVTQFFHPMPVEMASAAAVYGGIGLFMTFQLVALGLLFRKDVAADFANQGRP